MSSVLFSSKKLKISIVQDGGCHNIETKKMDHDTNTKKRKKDNRNKVDGVYNISCKFLPLTVESRYYADVVTYDEFVPLAIFNHVFPFDENTHKSDCRISTQNILCPLKR